MFDIGASLREARTLRGLTAEDAQKSLRIRERYLTALEEERWELLPGDAYTKGFLRTYAEFLGLDGNLYVDEFNERFAAKDEEPFVPESLAVPGRSRILFRTGIGLVVVAVGVAVAGVLGFGGSHGTHVDAPDLSAVAAAATPKPKPLPPVQPVAPAPAPKRRSPLAVIAAPKAKSWLSVRIGGPNGKEVFRGDLYPGQRLHYRLDRVIWLRMGRPHVLAIHIGRYRVRGLPHDPANLFLTKRGPRAG